MARQYNFVVFTVYPFLRVGDAASAGTVLRTSKQTSSIRSIFMDRTPCYKSIHYSFPALWKTYTKINLSFSGGYDRGLMYRLLRRDKINVRYC